MLVFPRSKSNFWIWNSNQLCPAQHDFQCLRLRKCTEIAVVPDWFPYGLYLRIFPSVYCSWDLFLHNNLFAFSNSFVLSEWRCSRSNEPLSGLSNSNGIWHDNCVGIRTMDNVIIVRRDQSGFLKGLAVVKRKTAQVAKSSEVPWQLSEQAATHE